MKTNKAACKRAFSMGSKWTVANSLNPNWNPGIREVTKVQSNAVVFGSSYLWFDQGDNFQVNEEGTLVEVRDESGEVLLTYTKVQEN